jgi:hypothetical protein
MQEYSDDEEDHEPLPYIDDVFADDDQRQSAYWTHATVAAADEAGPSGVAASGSAPADEAGPSAAPRANSRSAPVAAVAAAASSTVVASTAAVSAAVPYDPFLEDLLKELDS